jgi:hypothetical protein
MTINSNNMELLLKSNHDTDNPVQLGAYNRTSFNNTNNPDDYMSNSLQSLVSKGSLDSNKGNLFNQLNGKKNKMAFNSP